MNGSVKLVVSVAIDVFAVFLVSVVVVMIVALLVFAVFIVLVDVVSFVVVVFVVVVSSVAAGRLIFWVFGCSIRIGFIAVAGFVGCPEVGSNGDSEAFEFAPSGHQEIVIRKPFKLLQVAINKS